jgi:superfamily II DNA or RNA helicase
MLRDVKWAEDLTYRTGGANEPLQFYLDALSNSKSLDLLLGYFSSAAISILSPGFAKFLSSGGTMRLVVNNILSEKDKDTVKKGLEKEQASIVYDLSNIPKLKEILDEYGSHFFDCLAWLISNERIQIRIIKPKNGKGISHYKSGVFSDDTNQICFKGSCNFTAYGLLENLEEITTFLSWEDGRSVKEIAGQNIFFEEIFQGKSENVEFVNADEIQLAIRNQFGNKDINELIIQERELLEKKKLINQNKALKRIINKAEEDLVEYIKQPRFPYVEGPRPYQKEAYNKWVANGYKGLFAMATGTGKTITSLNCILEEYKLNKLYRFIVLVPTISLATQWEKEITVKFNFDEVTICSSSNTNWEESLRRYGRNLKLGNDINFCIVTTYASFRGKKFQRLLNDLFKDFLQEITLIADEAHTLGSINLLKVLPQGIEKRIGLSATPERQYDEDGELGICNFFNSFPPKYTFNYNMKTAIENNVLCKYFYYPKIVELESGELLAYRAITNKLIKFLDPVSGKYKDDPYVNNLLIQRKNIIHKARNKSKCLTKIIDEIGQDRFKYAFIYVPEGYEPNYEDVDTADADINDDNIIKEYTELLYNKYQFKVRKFTGDTKDRDEVLKQFTKGQLDALLAMKCLDEGVDIPQTQFAIFCSSTGNPRQYIQRRGRVLRYYGKKEFAHIYDMIVKPAFDTTDTDPKQYKLERSILLNELKRLVNFAVLAENKDDSLKGIEELCYSFDIDIYDLSNKEEEKYK